MVFKVLNRFPVVLRVDPLELHRALRGKWETVARADVGKYLREVYTPGVAKAVERIMEEPEESFSLTRRWNVVGIVSNGTRVLGLGDTGPEAALPVMEGKALLFKYFGGVDALPLVINEREVEGITRVVKVLEPSLGGVNLEDIRSPDCFHILSALREELRIPVWHDDQEGTAGVVLAALLAVVEREETDLRKSKIVLYGMGAANFALLRFLRSYGVPRENIVALDSKGVIGRHRRPEGYKEEVSHMVRDDISDEREAFRGADIVVAASRPGALPINLLDEADNPVVFALSNPYPDVDPREASKVARHVFTGKDVNNALLFPGLFRAVLTTRSLIDERVAIQASYILKDYTLEQNYFPLPPLTDAGAHFTLAVRLAKWLVSAGRARRAPSNLEEEIYSLIPALS